MVNNFEGMISVSLSLLYFLLFTFSYIFQRSSSYSLGRLVHLKILSLNVEHEFFFFILLFISERAGFRVMSLCVCVCGVDNLLFF